MSVPFPEYFEFDSINPNYKLNPETKSFLMATWGDIAFEQTILRYAPEGLLSRSGVAGIQDRMKQVGYLVILPKELAEEMRVILYNYTKKNPSVNNSGTINNVGDETHVSECFLRLFEESQRPSEDDPFFGMKFPGSKPSSVYPISNEPFGGYVTGGNITQGATSSNAAILKCIYTYDYLGQYFGSAKGFCDFYDDIRGINKDIGTLEKLKDAIEKNGDASLILICAERLETFLMNLNVQLKNIPRYDYIINNLYEAGLRKVLIHEMGHHMYPRMNYGNNSRKKFWSECMANWFSYNLMQPNERVFLYLWTQLQTGEYQSYTALVGLSMRNGQGSMLTCFNRNMRNKLITAAEDAFSFDPSLLASSYLKANEGFSLDEYSLDSFLSMINNLPKNQELVITHAEYFLSKLLNIDQYKKLQKTLMEKQSELKLKFTPIGRMDYHKMLFKEFTQRPSSIGTMRDIYYL